MKRILIIVIAVCLSISVVALIWNALSSKQMPGDVASRALTPYGTILNTIIPDARVSTSIPTAITSLVTTTMDIPLYPGAEITYKSCVGTVPDACEYHFTTNDTKQIVRDYYRDLVANAGWFVMEESGNYGSWGLKVYKRNQEGLAPMRWFLRMYIDPMPIEDGGRTRIIIIYDPWPDPHNVPLYPDAQQVEARWETDNESGMDAKRVTSYLTSATRVQIEAYYKAILPQHGWFYTDWQPTTRLNFGMSILKSAHDALRSGVEIRIFPSSDGVRRVELWARGTEIEADYMARHTREPKP